MQTTELSREVTHPAPQRIVRIRLRILKNNHGVAGSDAKPLARTIGEGAGTGAGHVG